MTTNANTSPSDRRFARAPGKLILSGEHSVVYGAPALSVALEQYTDVWFTPIYRGEGVRTAFENLSQGHFYPFDILKGFKDSFDRRFEAFARGDLPVQKILHRPDDLAVYTMSTLLQMLPVPGVTSSLRLPVPGQLNSRSDLPLGAGMGSSAAVIAATIVLYEHLLGVQQTLDERFEKVRFSERLQHGKGSPIDAAAVVYGGLNRVEAGTVTHSDLEASYPLRSGDGWYWVLHGVPQSSTGECVAQVRTRHGDDTALWQSFTECTNALHKALQDGGSVSDILTENHQLLVGIGVVPEAAQRFIEAVEAAGGAAKISGAGSIRGDYAGVILTHMEDAEAMAALMERYPERQWGPLKVADAGAALLVGEPQPNTKPSS